MCVTRPTRPKNLWGKRWDYPACPSFLKEQPNGTNQGRDDQETHDQPADQDTAGKQTRQPAHEAKPRHGAGQTQGEGPTLSDREGDD